MNIDKALIKRNLTQKIRIGYLIHIYVHLIYTCMLKYIIDGCTSLCI